MTGTRKDFVDGMLLALSGSMPTTVFCCLGVVLAITSAHALGQANIETEQAVRALEQTRNPEAIRLLVARCPLDQLRANRRLRDTFVRCLARTPIFEAQATMVALIKEGNSFVRFNALPYFRAVPCAEAGPYIVALFEDPEFHGGSLRFYPDLWFFANAAAIPAESKERLRKIVRLSYAEAQFDRSPAAAALPPVTDETLVEMIGITFEGKPVGLYPQQSSICLAIHGRETTPQMLEDLQKIYPGVSSTLNCPDDSSICYVHPPQQLTADQVILKETFYDSGWGFLLVQKNGKWIVVKRERLRIICR
jgi:hypothetical protein